MTKEEKEKLLDYLERERDSYQDVLQEARRERLDKTLEAREELRKHSVKFGELAFGFGAAIIPLFFVTDKLKDNELFVFAAAGAFLVSGFLGFFRVKSTLEADANNTPDIGLDLEISTYPRIYTINKLIAFPDNEEYKREYFSSGDKMLERYVTPEKIEDKVDFGLDFQYGFALLGTISLTKAVWPFTNFWFCILLLVVAVVFFFFVHRSYMNTKKKQAERQSKITKLYDIKKGFIDWQNEKIFGKGVR